MREQKKCKRTNEKGITLIALIISIIVMLILAGVSINAIVGDNGIITQAINVKTQAEIASEKEEISYIVIDGYSGDINTGTPLYDKTLANGSIWNIVVINDIQEVYGTGWYYIEAGTDIGDYGETKYGWLVNYETGEIVQLEEDNYTQLDYSSSLAVTDNLILNIDSGVIEDSDDSLSTTEQIANVEEQLGDNITLVGFDEEDWGEASGITSTSFNFDGVDDYIQIQYDSEEEKEALAENGFTFEFYGIADLGKNYIYSNGVYKENDDETLDYVGLMGYWNGDETYQARLRFGISSQEDGNFVFWNAGFRYYFSSYAQNGTSWNICYSDFSYSFGEKVYFSVVLDTSDIFYSDDDISYYKQSFYVNGQKICEGYYNVNSWNDFVSLELPVCSCFIIGRCSMGADSYWTYSDIEAYTLRLYARGLTEEEVFENYNTSVAYHTLLESMSESSE